MFLSKHSTAENAFELPAPGGRHDTLREGAALGVIVGTCTWLWVAIIDLATGEPFRTFAVLGGITAFTLVHYLLNVAYGIAIMSAVHGAQREPSLIFAVGFGLLIIEFAFGLLTAMLSYVALGALAWLTILGGSVLGVVIALLLIARRHALVSLLHQAEQET